jgi:hypothetical protein
VYWELTVHLGREGKGFKARLDQGRGMGVLGNPSTLDSRRERVGVEGI